MKHTLMILLASTVAACGQVQYAFTNFAGLPGGPGNVDGTGGAARFRRPNGVAADTAGNVYVADTENHTIRKITPAGEVTTLAGSTLSMSGSTDGIGNDARFYRPRGLAVDNAGNVYVADTVNSTIRKITPFGAVTTLAGSAGQTGSDDGIGSVARFRYPHGVAVDSEGNLYVADTGNNTIRKITPVGVVTTLAGSAGQSGSDDGVGSAARFGNLLGVVGPTGVAVDSAGNLYAADFANYTVRKISAAGEVTTLAGRAGHPGSLDGLGSAARFGQSYGPAGVAVDKVGNIYVADEDPCTIRKITPDGMVTTLAGSAEEGGSDDGIGTAARFSSPHSVAVDSAGNLYVADSFNNRITKGTPLFRFQISAGSLTISNGLFQMLLTGPFGSNAVLESSANLHAWTPIQTNTLSPDGLAVSLALGSNQNQFLRARLVTP